MLRARCVALATLDARLYEELAGELRERHLSCVSLVPGQRIPAEVSVVLTTPEEAGRFRHPRVIPIAPGTDRTALWAAVEQALHPASPSTEILLGLDPGPRPGYAVLSDERCLAEGNLRRPEESAELAQELHRRFPKRSIRVRVGDGDRPARERILNALSSSALPVEIVNEEGTTPRGSRRPRDAIAARVIARSPGRPVEPHASSAMPVTAGEIANVQRLSREHSGGQFTIPRAEAHRVLRGELTLSEAVGLGAQRYQARPSQGARPRRSTERS